MIVFITKAPRLIGDLVVETKGDKEMWHKLEVSQFWQVENGNMGILP